MSIRNTSSAMDSKRAGCSFDSFGLLMPVRDDSPLHQRITKNFGGFI